jgi:endonuclease/exonuclease/phosphatase family metal-dependent hydrolase
VAGAAGRRGGATSLGILELADKVGDQWTYHWSESDEYSRVDYAMASKALVPLVRKKQSAVYRAARWDKASDHRPLVVTIGLPATGTRK